MSTQNILVVDDNPDIRNILNIYLSEAGFRVYKAQNGKEALKILSLNEISLIIMDIMMPELDGIKATVQIREGNNIPIIILSAKTQERDKIEGLDAGADDYMIKPFGPQELIARVKAQLRRFTKLNNEISHLSEISIRGLEINLEAKSVTVNGNIVKLTPTEYKILHLLAKNRGKVLSVETIYESVWQQTFMNSESTVMFHISKLREKIEVNPKNPMYLRVVWGQGYIID